MLESAPGLLCRQAIAAAERDHGIPTGLLAAIGQVESGRPDPVSGALHPWPWTTNTEGQGAFFDTKAQAVATVRASQARGIRSIDVGCMQVNLLHHPDAFSSLEQAFDPVGNADYAARFLRQLFGQAGSWPQAAALYHSATPELAADYRRKVLAAWPEQARHVLMAAERPPFLAAWTASRQPGRFAPLRMLKLAPIMPVRAVGSAGVGAQPGSACPFAAIVGCNRIHAKATN